MISSRVSATSCEVEAELRPGELRPHQTGGGRREEGGGRTSHWVESVSLRGAERRVSRQSWLYFYVLNIILNMSPCHMSQCHTNSGCPVTHPLDTGFLLKFMTGQNKCRDIVIL